MALTQVATTGELVLAEVTSVAYTITDVQFLNTNTGEFQADPPGLTVGQKTSVGATGHNASAGAQSMQLVFLVTKPDGTQSTLNGVGGVQSVAAGTSFPDTTPAITLDQAGAWKVEVKLISDSTQLATTGQLVMATVTAAPPTMMDQLMGVINMAMVMMMFSMVSSMTSGFGEEEQEETESEWAVNK